MTRNQLVLLAAGGSAALLLGAFGFQLIGYPPCKLCLWQRWPHGDAIVVGLLAILMPSIRALPWVGALSVLTSAGVGAYHTGIERGWWPGPTSCTSSDITGLTPDQLMDQILGAPLIRCDEVAWQFLTLSMASWNVILSVGLAVFWTMAARRAA